MDKETLSNYGDIFERTTKEIVLSGASNVLQDIADASPSNVTLKQK